MTMSKKRALVTGATGFLGNRLVLALRKQGCEVVALVRRSLACIDPGICVLRGDLGQPETLDLDPSWTGRIDVLFHLGALLPNHRTALDATSYLTANAVATTRLLQTASARQIRTFVYASSMSIIGKPE